MPYTKIDSKWITDSNIKYRPINNFRKKYRRKSLELMPGKEILDLAPKYSLWKGDLVRLQTSPLWKILLRDEKTETERTFADRVPD